MLITLLKPLNMRENLDYWINSEIALNSRPRVLMKAFYKPHLMFFLHPNPCPRIIVLHISSLSVAGINQESIRKFPYRFDYRRTLYQQVLFPAYLAFYIYKHVKHHQYVPLSTAAYCKHWGKSNHIGYSRKRFSQPNFVD